MNSSLPCKCYSWLPSRKRLRVSSQLKAAITAASGSTGRACFELQAKAGFARTGLNRLYTVAGLPEKSSMPNNRWTLAAAWMLLCILSFTLSAVAKAPYTIKVWDTEDGLPQSSVIAMTQTRDGYLWLGTLNGLVRFDGFRFIVFDENNTPELGSSRIVSLFEDSRENFWIGTETAGIVLVKDGQITSLGIGRGSREGRLMSACEDSTGAVWLYTADGHLCRYRGGRLETWPVGADLFSSSRTIIAEESGPLWIGTDTNLSAISSTAALDPRELSVEQNLPLGKLDFLLASQRGGYWRLADSQVQKWRTNHLELDFKEYPWGRATVSAACEDQQGNLVVGTLGAGVFWFDSEGKATALSTNEGLSNNYILSLHVDREGSLWVGTDGGGLNRVSRQVFKLLDESVDLSIRSVCEDAQGGMWFSGLGVDYMKDGVVHQIVTGSYVPYVPAIFVDRNQKVWAGIFGHGLFQVQNGFFLQAAGLEIMNPEVSAIYQDRLGQLWVGTQNGLGCWDEHRWKVFTTREGLSANLVRAIADDPEGNLWVGTERGGLNRLRNGQFTLFRKKDGLPSDNVSSLYVDDEGVLWIGTSGGLARLQAGKWTRYTTHEGLSSSSIGYLIEDDQGYLWLGSNLGLMRVPKKSLNDFAHGLTNAISCRVYGKSDGLPTGECIQGSQPAACRTKSGTLWFPTTKGLAFVNPIQLQLNTNPPPVIIESVLIQGQEQNTNGLRAALPKTITIPASKEGLDIQFTSLNLAAADRARFKYQMEGHEKGWTEAAGNIRSAHYSKLPPGHYLFRVTAGNEDGVWNQEGSTLAVIVLPPFWRTWWFRGISTAFLLGWIIAIVHYLSTQRLQRQLEGLRQQQALEKERSRIARDIHDQVGANLTQVSLLGELVESDKNSPDEVEAHARQISQAARDTTRTLDEIVWTVNPSNDTLEGLITYACKYAQEYLAVAGLSYRLDAPTQLPVKLIPPELRHNIFLAFKEAITNMRTPLPSKSVCVWNRPVSRWRSKTTVVVRPAWMRRQHSPETGCTICANGWRMSVAVSRSARHRKVARWFD